MPDHPAKPEASHPQTAHPKVSAGQAPVIAVLTGDLIKSTAATGGALDHTMGVLQAAVAEIGSWHPYGTAIFQRYRGDGWQMALSEHAAALRAALYLLARLRADKEALGTRIFIGVDQAPDLPGEDLSSASGAAFVTSGRGLDKLSSQHILGIGGAGFGRKDQIILELLEQHVLKWTREQAEAAVLALHPDRPTLADMGKALGISPQAVNYRLHGGAIQVIRDSLDTWENILQGS